jgi:hypothetical protein
MPVRRRGISRYVRELSLQEEFELLLGTGGRPSFFRDNETRRAAWVHFREFLLNLAPAGKRPWAWWEYEAPERREGALEEASQLVRLGVVGAAELAVIEREWTRKDWVAHFQARLASRRPGGRLFLEALRDHRRLMGVPLDRPELDAEAAPMT